MRYQDALQATVALSESHGKVWKNRKIAVRPAHVKGKQMRILQERRWAYQERERRRQERALEGPKEEEEEPLVVIAPEEAQLLQSLDPDLLEGVVIQGHGPVKQVRKLSRRHDEDIDPNLNRKTRRQLLKTKPKRKQASSGFGSPSR